MTKSYIHRKVLLTLLDAALLLEGSDLPIQKQEKVRLTIDEEAIVESTDTQTDREEDR